ncbi:MAG: diacylglycerol kinase family protein [Pseudolysinimonas sp.]
MTERKATVVYNPIKVELDALKQSVRDESGAADWQVEWLPTSEEDAGQGAAKAALDGGAELVIVAGGDGTVRAVAEVVAGSKVPLALLPSGTGNLLARNMKLTLNDVPNSLSTAFTGTEREIDVARIDIRRHDDSVDSHVFLVMAGAGLDAQIMANTDDELKKKAGWLAYAQALIVVLRDKNVLRLNYKLDDRRNRSERARALIVGNCGSLPANIMLLPDAAVDDGLLDLIVLKPESFRGWLAVIVKIFWENGVIKRTPLGKRMKELNTESVDMHQGAALVVKLNRPEILQLDGDPFGEMVGCRVAVDPGALVVKVPAS